MLPWVSLLAMKSSPQKTSFRCAVSRTLLVSIDKTSSVLRRLGFKPKAKASGLLLAPRWPLRGRRPRTWLQSTSLVAAVRGKDYKAKLIVPFDSFLGIFDPPFRLCLNSFQFVILEASMASFESTVTLSFFRFAMVSERIALVRIRASVGSGLRWSGRWRLRRRSQVLGPERTSAGCSGRIRFP